MCLWWPKPLQDWQLDCTVAAGSVACEDEDLFETAARDGGRNVQ